MASLGIVPHRFCFFFILSRSSTAGERARDARTTRAPSSPFTAHRCSEEDFKLASSSRTSGDSLFLRERPEYASWSAWRTVVAASQERFSVESCHIRMSQRAGLSTLIGLILEAAARSNLGHFF